MLSMRSLIYVIFLCFASSKAADHSIFIEKPSSYATSFVAGTLRIKPFEHFDVTARVYCIGPLICKEESMDTVIDKINGSIVYTSSDFGSACILAPAQRAKWIAERGGVGMLLKEQRGVGSSYWLDTGKEDVVLPSLSLARNDANVIQRVCQTVATESEEFIVRMERPASNPWLDLTEGPLGIIYQIVFGGVALATGIWASLKFYRHGWRMSIATISLGLQIICCLLRVIAMIDPVFFHGVFSTFGVLTLITLPDPFLFCSMLLIAFYWSDLLSRVTFVRSPTALFVTKHKKFYLGTTIVIFILQLLLSIAGGLQLNVYFDFLQILISGIVCLFVAIYFMRSGYRVLAALPLSSTTQKSEMYKQMSRIINGVGVVAIALAISIALTATPLTGISAGYYLLAYFFVYSFGWLSSIGIIAVFRDPKELDRDTELDTHKSAETEISLAEKQQPADHTASHNSPNKSVDTPV